MGKSWLGLLVSCFTQNPFLVLEGTFCAANSTQSKTHSDRMIWVRRDFKDYQEHLPLKQDAPSHIQPGFEQFQGWGSTSSLLWFDLHLILTHD